MGPVNRQWVISGGIGSGKSTVRSLLEGAGFRTVDADSVGHRVLEPEGPAFEEVVEAWPSVLSEGRIDRAALGEIVFGDSAALKELESITHPHIFGIISARLEGFDGVVFVEVPLVNHRLGHGWTRLIVDADDETRRGRMQARGMTENEVRARMSSQPDRGEWLSAADLVAPNHGSLDDLTQTMELIVRQFRAE